MYGVSYETYQRVVTKRRLTRQEGSPDGPQEGEPELTPNEMQGGSNKIRNSIIVGVLVIILGVSLVIVLQPEAATGLTIGLNSGKVVEANSSDVILAIDLTIHNNTNKNMTYYGAQWAVSQDGNQLDSGIFFEHYAMPPGMSRTLNETVDINLGDVVLTQPLGSSGTWRFQGSATVDVAGANQTQGFDFNFSPT